MSLVNFVSGTTEEYNSLETKDPDTLYFISDSQTVYKGDDLYGGDLTKETIADDDEVKELVEAIFADITGDGTVAPSKLNFVILTSEELSENGVPNIEEPVEGILYYAPIPAQEQTDEYDSYAEWTYINSQWNRLGGQSLDIQDDDEVNAIIDSIFEED